ncbi:MAG: hypothetical protein B1H12_05455 [Desulfobacteraceae bacterium 4484_190.2]|nr:MAG: hypothetical protein B1H12_05455 [Desulfobacteraceae bacterium 4484_190.2]
MDLLALELSDAGIMAAAKDPLELLHIDGADQESPGFALPGKDQLVVGREAEGKAHLNPLQFNNSFWDQLNTQPLKQPNNYARNHAEMAYAHLARIWEKIREHGNELVIAVPGFLSRDQLGLILGIADELSISLKGMVALSVAAASKPCPDRMLLHIDIHLHRPEITFLEQGEHLTQKDSVIGEGRGLNHLYTEWVNAIAEEFVRTTRFDPLHQAAFEQELYSRLPVVIAALQQNPSVMFEIRADSKSYRVRLSRDLFVKKGEAVFKKIQQLIADMQERHGKPGQPMTFQLTHRMSRLPGCREMLAGIASAQVIELEPGCGAFGALDLWDHSSTQGTGRGVSLLTSRPWQSPPSTARPRPGQPISHGDVRPSHLLYRFAAYPLSNRPLTVGSGGIRDGIDVHMVGELAGISNRHCSFQFQGDNVILTDHSASGTFVDEVRVTKNVALKLGQIIRVGTPGEELQLIACVERNET